MKKSILFLALATTLFSCKKDETTDFTPTDVTGTSIVKGNVTKNIITPNSFGGWTTGTRIAAAGVAVSIKVNKNSLYPNSVAQGADVYSGTTDANGNYAITIKSNANGVAAVVSIDGFTGTLDTVVNGVTKTGLLANYVGTTQNRTVIMGQNSQVDHSFNASVVASNPNNNLKIGTATITGSVAVNFLKEILTGTVVSITTTNVPVAGRTVYCNFSNDPSSLATRQYTATTDANGYYTFNLTTVESGVSGFSQTANIYISDFATTRDTIKSNNTIKTGKAGVYGGYNLYEYNVYNNNIRNAIHFYYSSFNQN
jgi:hypothetical protein